MRPLRLELQGFRSFKERRDLDFTGLGLVAIVGDTGAGKSSILEAMSYALYGKPTFTAPSGDLICSSASAMTVRFEFEVDGRIYRITRSRTRTSYPPAKHILECDGDPSVRRETDDGVTRKVEELIGLDHAGFTKTVLLPQGDFMALLHARRGDRNKILKDILGLQRLDEMRNELEEPRDRSRDLVSSARVQLAGLPEDPEADLAVKQEFLVRAGRRESELVDLRESIATAQASIDTLHVRADKATADARALDGTDDLVAELVRISARDSFLTAQLQEASSRRATAQEVLNLRAKALDGLKMLSLDRAGIAEQRERVNSAEVLLEGTRHAQDDLVRATTKLAENRLAVIERLAASEATTVNISTAEARLQETESRLTANHERLKLLEGANAELTAASEALKVAIDAKTAIALSADTAAAKHSSTRDEHLSLEKELRVAQEDLSRARGLDGISGVVAHLGPGVECPVCRRILTPDYVPPILPDVEPLLMRTKRLSDESRAKADLLSAADAEERTQRAQLRNAIDSLAAAELRVGHAKQLLRTQFGGPDVRRIIADLALQENELRTDRDAALALVATERAGLAALEEAVQKIKAESAGLEDAIRRAESRSRSSEERLVQLAEGLPNACHDYAIDGPRAIEQIREVLSVLMDDAVEAESEVADAREVLDGLIRDHEELRERRDREVLAVRGDVIRELDARARLLLSLDEDVIGACSSTQLGNDASGEVIECWANSLRKETKRVRAALRKAASDWRESAAKSYELVARTFRELDVNGVGEIETMVDALRVEVVLAEVAAQRLALQGSHHHLLLERLKVLEPLAAALEALHRALGDSRFADFVIRRKERQLLVVASTILQGMTAERYAFAEDLKILDVPAGLERSAKTLSGGETFLASLALALALSEISARSGGHLGSLFLDEGFGSLDQTSLDLAMQELERRSASGRLIGVISHVKSVADYVNVVLQVTSSPTGSVISRLEDDALAGLAMRMIETVA